MDEVIEATGTEPGFIISLAGEGKPVFHAARGTDHTPNTFGLSSYIIFLLARFSSPHHTPNHPDLRKSKKECFQTAYSLRWTMLNSRTWSAAW